MKRKQLVYIPASFIFVLLLCKITYMQSKKASILTGAIAISFSAMLWGLDGVVLTPRLYNLDVGFVVMMIHLIPFLLMQPFLFKAYQHGTTLKKSDWVNLFLVALFGGAIGTLAIVKALFLTNFQHLTVVVLLQKLQPLFAISLAMVLLKERPRKLFMGWAMVAVVASYFMTFGWHTPGMNGDKNMIYAALYALLAAFSFGSATVLGKKVVANIPFQYATFYRYGLTTIIMVSIVAVRGKFGQINEVTPNNWFILATIALTTGSGAIFLYYYGLRKVRAIIATICELFFPLSAIVFDYLIYGTRLSAVQWMGAALLLFAIVRLNTTNARTMAAKNRT